MINKIRSLLSRQAPAQTHETVGQLQWVSTACPYCGADQDPPPQRRRMCRNCKETIYVSSDPAERTKCLLTAEDFNRIRQKQRHAQWQDLSRQEKVAMEEDDWAKLQGVYQQQARVLFEEGSPHRIVASKAHHASLMRMDAAGVKRVKVSTCQDERVCEECQAMNGKIYAIKDALEDMPLPGRNCTDGSQENPNGGRCRCVYLAIL